MNTKELISLIQDDKKKEAYELLDELLDRRLLIGMLVGITICPVLMLIFLFLKFAL